jgi:hypothetical protein
VIHFEPKAKGDQTEISQTFLYDQYCNKKVSTDQRGDRNSAEPSQLKKPTVYDIAADADKQTVVNHLMMCALATED